MTKETNIWLNMNTLIKRGQYSTMRSNTWALVLNGLIILYFKKMEFRKNSDILSKILIHKEVVIFVWNCAFSDKNDRFRQNGQVFWLNFQQLFFCWIQKIFYWYQIVWIQQINPKPFQPIWWVLCESVNTLWHRLNTAKQSEIKLKIKTHDSYLLYSSIIGHFI